MPLFSNLACRILSLLCVCVCVCVCVSKNKPRACFCVAYALVFSIKKRITEILHSYNVIHFLQKRPGFYEDIEYSYKTVSKDCGPALP